MMLVLSPRRSCALKGVCIVSLLLATNTRGSLASETPSDEIAWRTDYGQAIEEAKSQNELIWIQFTGPWCPNCRRMEEDSFPHPAIREQARRSFIPLKLRADLNEELALGFELSGLPATVVISPSRQVLAVHEGYMGPEELNGLLDQACQRFRPAELLASAKQTKSPTETAGKPAGPPKKEPELALSGYCPVSLIADRRLVAGSAEYTVSHEGRSYRLANLLTFNLFQRDPERYIPSNQGNCPVAKLERKVLEPGDPRFGVLFEGRLFLCATKADRDRFIKEPERFAAVDVVDQGFCVHCLAENGTYVRGNPRVALSREGRRYWFPDASHRDAFVTASASATMRR